MELGNQIKKFRNHFGMSQDVLAEKIFVSRQTISNWENDKSYPDVKSLLLLSEVFDVSVDILIKGDVEKMKKQVNAEDKVQFERFSRIFGILMILVIITPLPLIHFLRYVGVVIWIVLMAITMCFAIQLEKQKKQFDIQTYKEIIAFTEGKNLDEIAKAKEEGKRPYQKVLLAMASGVIALVVCILMAAILGIFSK